MWSAESVIDNVVPRPFAPEEDFAPAGHDGAAGFLPEVEGGPGEAEDFGIEGANTAVDDGGE